MSTPYYCALIPLAPDSNLTLDALALRLAARLPTYQVTCQADRVTVMTVTQDNRTQDNVGQGDWELSIGLATEDWVEFEAEEIAQMCPDLPNLEKLRQSSKRLEVSSSSDDYEMYHFNTYLFVLEVIEEFTGILFKFDPRDGELL